MHTGLATYPSGIRALRKSLHDADNKIQGAEMSENEGAKRWEGVWYCEAHGKPHGGIVALKDEDMTVAYRRAVELIRRNNPEIGMNAIELNLKAKGA